MPDHSIYAKGTTLVIEAEELSILDGQPRIDDFVRKILDANPDYRQVVVHGLQQCRSDGLGALVALYTVASNRELRFALSSPGECVRQRMRQTQCDTVFPMYSTLTEALAEGKTPLESDEETATLIK